MKNAESPRAGNGNLLLVGLVFTALLAGIYWTVRYNGWAMEVDAARQTASAGGILATGHLVTERAYNNGYAYGAVLAFVSMLAGVPLQSVQLASGLWMFVVILAGFVAYRELLGDKPIAALATFFLLLQPDFLFYVLRGSHEKMTWSFALLMLFLLGRSFRFVRNPVRLAIYVALFYVAFFSMATSNAYFASTFLTAILISFAAGWVVTRLRRRGVMQTGPEDGTLRRLMIIALICSVIVFAFVAYLYRPALAYFWFLKTLLARLGMLFAATEPAGKPASYTYFGTAWRSNWAYLLLTGVQWLIAAAGVQAWLWMARSRRPEDDRHWLVWLMYAGFGVQIAYGIVADFTHMLSDNMQMRLFTPLALFTAPLAAWMVADLFRRLAPRWRRLAALVAAPVGAFAVAMALLKVTNDPLFGNQWLFYSPPELRAAQWADANVQDRRIWVDTAQVLDQAFDFRRGYREQDGNTYTVGKDFTSNDYILISDLLRLRTGRTEVSLPPTSQDDLVYDNGEAQLYHPRQRTPYQR